MTESEIQFLKENIDKLIEIETTDGERLIAKVVSVTHSQEYDEHDVQYEMISTNMPEAYSNGSDYILDFDNIISVKLHSNQAEAAKS